MQARVEVDKRQILALLGGEGFCRATHAGHPIQLFVRASKHEEAQMNVRCPSSDDLRPIRYFENGGSGSSGVRV